MDEQKLKIFDEAISKHQYELTQLVNSRSEKGSRYLNGTTLDQVLQEIDNFKEALVRIKNGSFGICTVCNGEVESDRIEQDFTTCVCLDHYTRDELRSLERDLELTAKVQKDLLPSFPPGQIPLQIAYISQPARIVSGDYYDFFKMADGSQGIAIADVMGKGLPASILMANIQASLRTIGPETNDVRKIVTRLNQLFSHNMKMIKFISFIAVSVDTEKNLIHYANAGHNPAAFWDSQKKEIRWLNPTGPAIGIIKNYTYESKTFTMHDNDLLVLYTDGLTETRNTLGEEFGDFRLADFIIENNSLSVNEIMKNLKNTVLDFSKTFDDDLTVVLVKR